VVSSLSSLVDVLQRDLGPGRVRQDAPLAPFTTFKLGGAADCVVDAASPSEIQRIVALAGEHGVPVTVLGGGSNVLVADAGVRGVVLRMRAGEIRQPDGARVRADAGVTINGLVRWTVARGLAGLEAWAGTPGTVGGAIFGNAHFQGRNIGDLVELVTLAGPGRAYEVPSSEMAFAYDCSRLQRSGEVLLSADFRVTPGVPDALRAVARESLAFRKRTQPLASPSAGCIFQNPHPSRDIVPPGVPWSAGALVDRAGMKGAVQGHARVSATHANFIVNEGDATAADVRTLIARCKAEVRRQFGVELREEIVYLGFDDQPAGRAPAED
jgi:UDP-N-acetylmuramate dehydrogenase